MNPTAGTFTTTYPVPTFSPITEEQKTALQRLREPFPPEVIGKLPRITCRDCSQAQGRVCNKHQKSKCPECGNWITSAHMHLDYVGHAEITDRFLDVDPEWSWTPVAFNERGLPAMVTNDKGQPIGMWITLTIQGVSRLGYGSCEAGKSDAVKELIGDALRNAGMRFGAALDLWAKGKLESEVDAPAAPDNEPVVEPYPAWLEKLLTAHEEPDIIEMAEGIRQEKAPDKPVLTSLRAVASLKPATQKELAKRLETGSTDPSRTTSDTEAPSPDALSTAADRAAEHGEKATQESLA